MFRPEPAGVAARHRRRTVCRRGISQHAVTFFHHFAALRLVKTSINHSHHLGSRMRRLRGFRQMCNVKKWAFCAALKNRLQITNQHLSRRMCASALHRERRVPTDPHVDVVGRSLGGEEQHVGVAGVEGAMQGLRTRLQVQVLDAPRLEAWLLPSCGKLLMGNHDVSEEGGGRRGGDGRVRKLH